jgi:hypothetical protein
MGIGGGVCGTWFHSARKWLSVANLLYVGSRIDDRGIQLEDMAIEWEQII